MELSIVCREIIRPSKPTPDKLRTYKLSAMDESIPHVYVPVLLVYASQQHKSCIDISRKLRKSLSETLTTYYPLAGQMVDEVSINCNDSGVPFSEARVDHELADIPEKPESLEVFDLFFHDNMQWKMGSKKMPLLTVSLNLFSCGGFAVGICFSHKFGDAYSISTFLNDWAAITRCIDSEQGDVLHVTPPQLISASVFPPNENSSLKPKFVGGDLVTRRFVFSPSKIASLKAIVSGSSSSTQLKPPSPTRVEVVTALFFKCASSKRASTKPPLLLQVVNIRHRMGYQLPDKTIGNLVWYFPVMITDGKQTSIRSLVAQMRDQLLNICNLEGEQWLSILVDASTKSQDTKDEIVMYKCSSWCGFPVYKVDFGWGEPFWVTTGLRSPWENTIILMDTKSGLGIEAYVTLNRESMAALEADVDFLQFASLNHSILEDEVHN